MLIRLARALRTSIQLAKNVNKIENVEIKNLTSPKFIRPKEVNYTQNGTAVNSNLELTSFFITKILLETLGNGFILRLCPMSNLQQRNASFRFGTTVSNASLRT